MLAKPKMLAIGAVFQMICDYSVKVDIRKLARRVPKIPDIVFYKGERVVTTWTETAFGGRRQWFLCPSCDRRCAIIYRVGNGPLWGCRLCMRGRYASERLSSEDRKLHKAFSIRERLGQRSGGIIAPFPPKPKHMHWRTYERIRSKALRSESEFLIKAHARLLGITLEAAAKDLL